MDDTTPPGQPETREQFIAARVAQHRAEHERLQTMTTKELLADLQQSQEAQWRLAAESEWSLRQARAQLALLPPSAPSARPVFPPGTTVPPDVGSRLEALEDSVALLHTKLDTLIAQIAAWERGQDGAPDTP